MMAARGTSVLSVHVRAAMGTEGCFAGLTERWIYGTKDMDQDTRWLTRYQDVMDFMEKNHRNPSRHRMEEHDMLNWLKANRKKMNAGELLEPRLGKFKELLALCEEYRRVNQYA